MNRGLVQRKRTGRGQTKTINSRTKKYQETKNRKGCAREEDYAVPAWSAAARHAAATWAAWRVAAAAA